MLFSKLKLVFLWALLFIAHSSIAHENVLPDAGTAKYLGNEGVLITSEFGNVLFDPFFHKDYGSYTLVPKPIRDAIFAGDAPYNEISAILISHAHGDHFSAEDALLYLKRNKHTYLIGPDQAIDKVRALNESSEVDAQLIGINTDLAGKVVETNVARNEVLIKVESVHIPHAGWPNRKDVTNLVHRVTFGEHLNVIHMGDADPNDIHFKPYKEHWEKSESELAFPPYWFFTSRFGPTILSERINATKAVGVHVPTQVPPELKQTEQDFFSIPGETRRFVPR